MLCYSESFESLSEGLQNALWELGAVPARHRTDSLSSAVNNMSNLEEFNQRYEAVMKPLPARRMESYKRERVKVDSGSLVWVDRNVYSVNSRLIGERVEARLYPDRVEVWYAQRKVEDLPRLRGRSKHRVDYRHIIDWLVRKPGAFESYRYREDLFPSSQFRMAYDTLRETRPQSASKEYLKILELAAKQSEARVEDALRMLLGNGAPEGLDSQAVEALLGDAERIPAVTSVEIAAVDLASFDALYRERVQ